MLPPKCHVFINRNLPPLKIITIRYVEEMWTFFKTPGFLKFLFYYLELEPCSLIYIRKHSLSPFPRLKTYWSRSANSSQPTQHLLLMNSGRLLRRSWGQVQTQQEGVWWLIDDVCLGEGGGNGSTCAMYLPFLVRTESYSSLYTCA